MPLLISQQEIHSLPGDPKLKFVALEEIVRTRYEDMVRGEEEWQVIQDARLQYMGEVIGAAKYLKISPLCDLDLPRKADFNDNSYEDFKGELHFYTMQLALEGADRAAIYSIELGGSTKDRLITLSSHLRDHVRKLDLPPGKIDRLLDRISAFEKELEERRLGFAAVAVLTLTIAGAIADLDGAATVVRQLINQMEEAVGIAKEEEAKAHATLPPLVEPRRLEPPRKAKVQQASLDLNDDIPF